MALHRADPAHFRADHGDRLALDHRLGRQHFDLAAFGKGRSPSAQRGFLAKLRAHFAQLVGDAFPLARLGLQQVVEIGAFLEQRVAFAAQFHFLQPPQAAQAHVEDRLGLHFAEFALTRRGRPVIGFRARTLELAPPFLAHQRIARAVVIADDVDHPVEVQIGDDEAFQHLEPVVDLVQPVLAAALQDLTPVVEEGAQHLAQAADLWRAAVDQHVHVQAEADLQIGDAHQHAHHLFGIDVLGPRLQHDADVIGGFVAHIGQQRHLFQLDHLGQLFDQLGFCHLIGDLGDDHLPDTARQLFDLPARAQSETAAPGAIAFQHRRPRLDDHPAGGKIGAGDQADQRVIGQRRVADQRLTGGDQLIQIVRRDVGRHAHRDPAGPIGQQVRKGGRQHDGFFQRAIVIGAEIDGILGQPVQQRLGGGGQAGSV